MLTSMAPPDVLLHFSEDPTIARFDPHVPATNPEHVPAVWAIDEPHAPVYWFPRDCPRGSVWASSESERLVLADLFHTTAHRVHARKLGWLERIRHAELFVYELDPAPFTEWPVAEGQWIASEPVVPIGVRPVGDLLDLHVRAGIELRFVPDLSRFWDVVVASGLSFSGVRLRYP
jgi:hypothetical protein